MIKASVTFDLSRSRRLIEDLRRASPRSSHLRSAYDFVERRYTEFVLKRFDLFSRGGGNWPPLAAATVKRKKSKAILVDTRAMRLGLQRGIGAARRSITGARTKLTIAFTNKSKHPAARNLTIADLASIHHLGLGNVPARKILVGPDQRSTGEMREKLIQACAKTLME